jgi:hypothetical protein
MATTTNYGWETPDDTDLVKDGALAIRTLGSSIDTTTKNLNPSTTLGDIEYRSSTANTNTRLGIGSTGQVLTVSGGVPTWATPAGGGAYTSIASGNLSGVSSVTISNISQAYKDLYLVAFNPVASSGRIGLRINGDTASNYQYWKVELDTGTGVGSNGVSVINVGLDITNATNWTYSFYIENYATTSYKPITVHHRKNNVANGTSGWAHWNNSDAYTSLTIVNTDAVNYTSGTYTLYGVK